MMACVCDDGEWSMANISYVYPNVSGILQRGGLLERWQLAEKLGCEYIEIPADFIKNKTEIEKTDLNLGDLLTEEAIAILYKKDYDVPQELKYILHTEPSLVRSDGYGLLYQAPLKWYDKGWREKFVNMVVSISDFFGVSAAVVEIHPGDRRNSFGDIVVSIIFLLDRYHEDLGVEPLVLIENRTGQSISNGKEILLFWKFLSENYPQLQSKVGIVLDVQQLYTTTKRKFLKHLEMTPLEALKGFHIHHKHRVPSLSNKIPWRQIFGRIVTLKNDVFINPEILHKKKVEEAIKFCEEMLQANAQDARAYSHSTNDP